MLPIIKTASIMVLLAVTSVASGPTVDPDEDSNRGSNGVTGDDLPNGTAFYMTLLQLDNFNTRFGPADVAAWTAVESKTAC